MIWNENFKIMLGKHALLNLPYKYDLEDFIKFIKTN